MEKRREIIIAGAGLSGLVSAINLANAGYRVKIYEKNDFIGQQKKETVQLIPNWFSKQDVIEELERCGVKINWRNKLKRVEIYLDSSRKVVFYCKKIPIGYTVLRGGENSIEKDLARHARMLNVKIVLGAEYSGRPDIIAIGISNVLTVGLAKIYKGDFNPEIAKVFFNSAQTPTIGYAYLFPHNKSLATFKISKKIGETTDIRANLMAAEEQYLSRELQEKSFLYEFGTKRSFNVPNTAMDKASYIVGEAAGFQDELFRFGIRYAVISGYLAAYSIIHSVDYDELWKQRFSIEFEKTTKIRKLFCISKKQSFAFLPFKVMKVRFELFRKIWNSRLFEKALRFV